MGAHSHCIWNPKKYHENRNKIVCAIEFELIGFSIKMWGMEWGTEGSSGVSKFYCVDCGAQINCVIHSDTQICNQFSSSYNSFTHTSFYNRY